MKFSINQSEFLTTLNIVYKGVSTRSTLPILSGILIRSNEGYLTLEATDMDTSIKTRCAALVEEDGEVVVPAKLLIDIVKSLPDTAIHFSTDETSATLLCDSSSFSLKTLNPIDFPVFPDVNEEEKIELDFQQFSSAAKRVARAVSRDESQPVLSGVLAEVSGGVFKMVATDSYRLALKMSAVDQNDIDFSAVIPGTFLNDIATLPADAGTIKLALSENQIIAYYRDSVFISRRVEGNYPNYNPLLASESQTVIKVATKQLAEAVRRVSLMSNNVSPVRLDVNNASQTIQVSSNTQDIGAAQETIGAEITGEDIQIAFNARYLNDGLNSIEKDEVELNLQSSVKPGIFETGEDGYKYLIMPVRL